MSLYAKFVPEYIPGDVNNDGTVNIMDVTELQRFIAGYPVTIYIFETADVDKNGEINILDATMIQRYLAGYLELN